MMPSLVRNGLKTDTHRQTNPRAKQSGCKTFVTAILLEGTDNDNRRIR